MNFPSRRSLAAALCALAAFVAAALPATAFAADPAPTQPAAPAAAPEPFGFADFTWMNGQNRQKASAFPAAGPFTPSVLLDLNYDFSFNRPIDHSIVGSTVTGRHNELNLLMASVGGDFRYQNVRATLNLQFGTRTNLVPRNDPSALRGQYDLAGAMRFLREAYAGYHFDVGSGLNIDAGQFMSYIGLASYLSFENWMYQPSYVSDNTPFYFDGVRLQAFPTDHTHLELWLTNGWQSFAKFNESPGFGYQFEVRPTGWLSAVTNGYLGFETRGAAGRARLHSDSSVQVRYFQGDGLFERAAVSVTLDAGCESGGGAGCGDQFFLGGMVYHRAWLRGGKLAWTVGGGAIDNPGRYLVLSPPGAAGAGFPQTPGTSFVAWDASTGLDFMPNDFITLRAEILHRQANVPYFAGRGGSTSPDGWVDTPAGAFVPDRTKSEDRVIGAMMVRF